MIFILHIAVLGSILSAVHASIHLTVHGFIFLWQCLFPSAWIHSFWVARNHPFYLAYIYPFRNAGVHTFCGTCQRLYPPSHHGVGQSPKSHIDHKHSCMSVLVTTIHPLVIFPGVQHTNNWMYVFVFRLIYTSTLTLCNCFGLHLY